MTSVIAGRGPNVDITVPDEYASPRHAHFWDDAEGNLWVEDLGSTNGTWVIGSSGGMRRVHGPTRVLPGESVRIGRTVLPFRPHPDA